MRVFNRARFLELLTRYVNRTLPVEKTMPDEVCERLTEFLKSDDPQNGAGLLDEMHIEYCPEYERGDSLWDLCRYGDNCTDEERTILKETAVAFGRYFLGGEDVVDRIGGAEKLKTIWLHKHQSDALKAYREEKNILVCTGTGSGKTECFLMPIIDKILRERKTQSAEDYANVSGRHIHAMIMYPMNALVNDQIKRLRQIISYIDFTGDLEGKPITFGMYTGESKKQGDVGDDESEAINECLRIARPAGQDIAGGGANPGNCMNAARPITSEYLTRDQWMKNGPADIMVTNYSMMEQLLIRPDKDRIFQGGNWDFIVLDEAHSYTGSTCTEIAWQMRRIERRLRSFAQEGAYRLPRFIATSATLVKGDVATQTNEGEKYMRAMFPTEDGADVFVGIDSFASVSADFNGGAATTGDFSDGLEELIEKTAKFEEAVKAKKEQKKLYEYLKSTKEAQAVSAADAVWLATCPAVKETLNVQNPKDGWVRWMMRVVKGYTQTVTENEYEQRKLWRDTLHDYNSSEYSFDNMPRGNKLRYLEHWMGRRGAIAQNISGDEFRYLAETVQEIRENAELNGRQFDLDLRTIKVDVEFEIAEMEEGTDFGKEAKEIADEWNRILGNNELNLTEESFSVEKGWQYKEALAGYLMGRKDFRALYKALNGKRIQKVAGLMECAREDGAEIDESRLWILLQMAGLAKLAGKRKPLMDVKCHQAFRGVADVGVWFDENGDYHFVRSVEEYVNGRKVFSLGVCRDCGQLYLLGYTDNQALPGVPMQNKPTVLWRYPTARNACLHAVALPFEGGNEPYAAEKVVGIDDRDDPMPILEAAPRGAKRRSPWNGWMNDRVHTLAAFSVNLKTGEISPGEPNPEDASCRRAYWCLDGEESLGENAFLSKCPACGNSNDRDDSATYGIITPYEAEREEFKVASLEAFAHTTEDKGRADEVKVLAFSDSRQAASTLALEFENMAFRSYAESAICEAARRYKSAIENAGDENRLKIFQPRNKEEFAETEKQIQTFEEYGSEIPAQLLQKRDTLMADVETLPLTVNNLVEWGLMPQDRIEYLIQTIEADGTRTSMKPNEAQKFIVIKTFADVSTKGRLNAAFYSKTINQIDLADNAQNLDCEDLRRCLQRIFRSLVKKTVIEGSGNDYEVRTRNEVYRPANGNQRQRNPDEGTITDWGYHNQNRFCRRYYVVDAIKKFFPQLNDNGRRLLGRYFWGKLCNNNILTQREFAGGTYYMLNFKTLCNDIVVTAPTDTDSETMHRLTIQEHTAQISGLKGAFYQQRFAEGGINVLSCSTTFEMGIDVGGLNNVFLGNLPPYSANYKQRAGRAGRRPGALAQIVTFAQGANWADNPMERMIDGNMAAPRIRLDNPIYKARHLRAEALRFFLKYAEERRPMRPGANGNQLHCRWNNAGAFLIGFRYTWENEQNQNGQGWHREYKRLDNATARHSIVEQCGADWLSNNCESQYSSKKSDEYATGIRDVAAGEENVDFTDVMNSPACDMIFQLIGDRFYSRVNLEGIRHWSLEDERVREYYIKRGGCYMPRESIREDGSVRFVWPGANDSMRLPLRERKMLLMRRMYDLDGNEEAFAEAIPDGIQYYMLGGNEECPAMVRRLLDEYTINTLSSCGIIPKYGFPIDVVELVVEKKSKDVDLNRDMTIGLFEYAPEQVLVADKRKYRVYKGRDGVLFNRNGYEVQNNDAGENRLAAWHCRDCDCICSSDEAELDNEGGRTLCPDCGNGLSRIALVRPDAFKAKVAEPSARKKSKGRRIVRLATNVDVGAFRQIGNLPLEAMFDANRTISYFNANNGSGFDLSERQGQGGILANSFLTHDVHTDVVIWRLSRGLIASDGALGTLQPQANRDMRGMQYEYGRHRYENAMKSALAAVRLAAVRRLNVFDREIGAFLYKHGTEVWWVLYDATQGGGGNVLPLAKSREDDVESETIIKEILEGALKIVTGCNCTGDANEGDAGNKTPIPISEYRAVSVQNGGADLPYREAKACLNCIMPRFRAHNNDVYDCVDAAMVLKALLGEVDAGEPVDRGEDGEIDENMWVRFEPDDRLVPMRWYKLRDGRKEQYNPLANNVRKEEIEYKRR